MAGFTSNFERDMSFEDRVREQEQTREVAIDGVTFIAKVVEPHNLWSIRPIKNTKTVPVELDGLFTSYRAAVAAAASVVGSLKKSYVSQAESAGTTKVVRPSRTELRD